MRFLKSHRKNKIPVKNYLPNYLQSNRKQNNYLSIYKDVGRLEIHQPASIKYQQLWKRLPAFQKYLFKNLGDADNDGVPNGFDCQPYNLFKQDFKPNPNLQEAEQNTAAKKFGTQNLRRLEKLGAGRDREVYALDDDKVIKIAKNPGGLVQNEQESELEFWKQGKVYEKGKDYVVVKRYKSLSPENKRKLKDIQNRIYDNNVVAPRGLIGVIDFEKEGIPDYILNYNFNVNELFKPNQWGEDEEGNLVLLDAGALLSTKDLIYFREKHFRNKRQVLPESEAGQVLDDWQDIKEQRKQYRTKGKFVPSCMKYYEENSKNSQNRGVCHDAALCIVREALKNGFYKKDIKVLGIKRPNPIKGDYTSHVVTVIGNTVYDPTRTQFGENKTIYSIDELKQIMVDEPVDYTRNYFASM